MTSAPVLVALLGVLGMALAVPATAVLIRWGHRRGVLDSPGAAGHVKTLRLVPNIGGVAVAFAVLGPAAVGLGTMHLLTVERVQEAFPALAASLARLPQVAFPAWVVVLGALAMHLLGVVDDRRALRALPKLGLQVTVALGTVLAADIRVLTLLDQYPAGAALSVALTVAWVVVVCNSLNFLDNMDGLAGGVGAIGGLALCVGACMARQWMTAAMLALLCGAVVGFLCFNAPWTRTRTARIFMGDGGSLLIGFLLAVLAVRIVFVNPDDPTYALGTHWYGVLAPLVILAVPLYDAVSVTLLRLRQGRNPMVGDQQHFSHRLVQRGLTRRGAVLVIWALAGVCGVSGLLLGTAASWQAGLIAVQVLLVLGTLAGLELPMLGRMGAQGRSTNP